MPTLPNQDKVYLVNPKMSFTVFGDTDINFETREATVDSLEMEFFIEKDIEDEPNEAQVTVYNLSEGSRRQLVEASYQNAPIELRVTPSDVDELALVFRGEIDSTRVQPMSPGHAIEMGCTSQKKQHRAFYIDKKTYAAGTSRDQIVDDFLAVIGMPVQWNVESEPHFSDLLLSHSFSGSAFALLKSFVYDMGRYCFINDGVIHISSIYEPQNPTVKDILKKFLLGKPQDTDVSDGEDVEMRTVTETVHINPLSDQRRRKKKTKAEKRVGENDYVEYQSVDTSIPGMDFVLLCQPDLQPDDIIRFPDYDPIKETLFRVRSVQHETENSFFDSWTTEVSTSIYNPTGGALTAGL
jgi:hypothetical protein